LLLITTTSKDRIHMLHLYRIARDLILHISKLDQISPGYISHLPHYFLRAMSTAAHCILRLCRSPLRQNLDLQDAETTFFMAVNLLKQASIDTNDLYSMSSIILPQLWSSNAVFVRADGLRNTLYMDLRDRLVSCRFHKLISF
jgi:transcriptional regulatory protein LEU3